MLKKYLNGKYLFVFGAGVIAGAIFKSLLYFGVFLALAGTIA